MTTKVCHLMFIKSHISYKYSVFNNPMKNLKTKLNWSVYLKFCVSQFYPTHLRSVYDPTETILAVSYKEVPHVIHAKYQVYCPRGSGEEGV